MPDINVDQTQNPYAPPPDVGNLPTEPPSPRLDYTPRSWSKSAVLWSAVCVISAAPSFVWGFSTIAGDQAAAMCLGIAIFIVGYILADQGTQKFSWRRDQSIRLTLKIGYITRLVVSVIFPIGGFLDMFCGFMSLSAVELAIPEFGRGQGGAGFLATLLVTIVQGFVLNFVLTGYMAIVFGFVLIAHRGRDPRP